MNTIVKLLRSIREPQKVDAGFESYYTALIRSEGDGVPTAAEARRDFRAIRHSAGRTGLL